MTAEQKLREIAETDNPAAAAAAHAYLASLDQAVALVSPCAHSVHEDETAAGTTAGNASERVHSGQARAARLLDDAEHIARSITDKKVKAWALSEVAAAVAATDPDRAARLLAGAIRIARPNAWALRHVADAVAATHPHRAERIVQSITDNDAKMSAFGNVAAAMAATDPDRAERIAQSITNKNKKELALRDVAPPLQPPTRTAQKISPSGLPPSAGRQRR